MVTLDFRKEDCERLEINHIPTHTRQNKGEEVVDTERTVHREHNRHDQLDLNRQSNEEQQTQSTAMDY